MPASDEGTTGAPPVFGAVDEAVDPDGEAPQACGDPEAPDACPEELGEFDEPEMVAEMSFCTARGSTCTASPSSAVSYLASTIGMVWNPMEPELIPGSWVARLSTSSERSTVTALSTASIRALRLVASVSGSEESTVCAMLERTPCWRRARSRSPPGRPCRCRTNARAWARETVCGPAANLAPENESFTAEFKQTGTPPTAWLTSANPERLTAAKWVIVRPVRDSTAAIVALAPAAPACTARSFPVTPSFCSCA